MKFKTIVLAVFYVVSIKGSAQVTETTDTLTPLKMGEAYLSESKKIGVITYGDATLNVSIRKEKNFVTGQTSKSIFFSGTNNDGAAEGFIDLSELNSAINALKFICDSLLPHNPENEVHFAKRFTNSSFVIYASYSLTSSALFSKNEWDVVFQLSEKDYTGTQGIFHIRKQDIPKIAPLLISGRERLTTF